MKSVHDKNDATIVRVAEVNGEEPTDDLFVPAPLNPDASEAISAPSVSFWKEARERLFKNKGAVISLVFLVILILLAIIGPMMNEHTYRSQNLVHTNLPPKVSGLEWLGFNGLDARGNDVYGKETLR